MYIKKIIVLGILALYVFSMITFAMAQVITGSLISVDADYVTTYPGADAKVSVDIENKESFDIEDISIALQLNEVPFSSIGSSQKEIDDLDEDDNDKVSFTLRASTDAKPGDYNIPYIIKYVNADDKNESHEKNSGYNNPSGRGIYSEDFGQQTTRAFVEPRHQGAYRRRNRMLQ